MSKVGSSDDLFAEDVYDALRGLVARCGGTKAVGHRLWPHKAPDAAGMLLSNCLNRDRDEKLDPEQLLLLLRWGHELGFRDAKHWIDREVGYAPSAPVEPSDQLVDTIRTIRASLDGLHNDIARFDRLVERVEKRGAKT